MIDQQGPQFVEYAFVFPPLERSMHGGIVSELFGQSIPLTAGANAVNDAVEAFPGIGTRASHLGRGIEFREQGEEEMFPKGIGRFPNRRKSLFFFCSARC